MDNLTAKVAAILFGSSSETRNPDSGIPEQSKTCRSKVAGSDSVSKIPEPRGSTAETKSARDYHISTADGPSRSEITALKNRCVSKYLRGQLGLIKTLSTFKKDELRIIMKLASYQDNNEAYFRQLKSFSLPNGHHSVDYEEALETFLTKMAERASDNFWLCSDLLLAEASNGNRLVSDFGIYFPPSSVWLNPVAEKLTSLNCKKGIEVFAGKGYLSYFLTTYGFQMLASDNQQNCHPSAPSAPVRVRKENSIETVNKFKSSADFLVVCWPPSWDNTSLKDLFNWPPDYQILMAWGESKPILFVGERPPETSSNAHESVNECNGRTSKKEEYRSSLGYSTGSLVFHNHLTMYFDAHPVEQYRGRKVGSFDEAIIYTPNGKKAITMSASELKNFVDTLSNSHSD